jgi:hypothetical protein
MQKYLQFLQPQISVSAPILTLADNINNHILKAFTIRSMSDSLPKQYIHSTHYTPNIAKHLKHSG